MKLPRPAVLLHAMTLLLGLALLPGCGDGLPDVDAIDTPEEVLEGFKACADKIVATMEKIDDMDSFEANKEDLTAAYSRMLDVAQKAESFEQELSGENGTELEAEFREYNKTLRERMEATDERLKDNPELTRAIREHLNEVTQNHPYVKEQEQALRERLDQSRSDFERQVQEQRNNLSRQGNGTTSPGSDAFIQSMGGPSQVVTLVVQDIPAGGAGVRVRGEVQRAAQGPMYTESQPTDTTQTYLIGLAPDIQALANRITFGEVRNINQQTRTITVRYNQ